MSKHLLIFLSLINLMFFVSCNKHCDKSTQNCISPILEKSFMDYINEKERIRIIETPDKSDTIYNYYSIFFHGQNEKSYFSIFQAPWTADILFPEVKKNDNLYYFLLFTINKRSVYLISEKSIITDGLFKPCEESITLARKELATSDIQIYDGSYYPVTYQYFRINDKIFVTKLTKPILDFNPDLKRYEEYHSKIK